MPGAGRQPPKSSGRARVVLGLVTGLLLAGIIGYNNRDLFNRHRLDERSEESPAQAVFSPSGIASEPKNVPSSNDTPPAVSPSSSSGYHVLVEGIRCPVTDPGGGDFDVLVSLQFRASTQAVKDELTVREGEVRAVVRRVFVGRTMTDVQVDVLRKEIIGAVSAFLAKGTVEDVEFIDFRPLR